MKKNSGFASLAVCLAILIGSSGLLADDTKPPAAVKSEARLARTFIGGRAACSSAWAEGNMQEPANHRRFAAGEKTLGAYTHPTGSSESEMVCYTSAPFLPRFITGVLCLAGSIAVAEEHPTKPTSQPVVPTVKPAQLELAVASSIRIVEWGGSWSVEISFTNNSDKRIDVPRRYIGITTKHEGKNSPQMTKLSGVPKPLTLWPGESFVFRTPVPRDMLGLGHHIVTVFFDADSGQFEPMSAHFDRPLNSK